MKKALISPLEPRETGYRVAEAADISFEVSQPLFWVDCADEILADVYWYNHETQSFSLTPVVEVLPQTIATQPQPTTQGAQTL